MEIFTNLRKKFCEYPPWALEKFGNHWFKKLHEIKKKKITKLTIQFFVKISSRCYWESANKLVKLDSAILKRRKKISNFFLIRGKTFFKRPLHGMFNFPPPLLIRTFQYIPDNFKAHFLWLFGFHIL